jgi:hypothetical protein
MKRARPSPTQESNCFDLIHLAHARISSSALLELTDGDGRYEYELSSGTFVVATAPVVFTNPTAPAIFYPGVPAISLAARFELKPGDQHLAIDFVRRLVAGGVVQGPNRRRSPTRRTSAPTSPGGTLLTRLVHQHCYFHRRQRRTFHLPACRSWTVRHQGRSLPDMGQVERRRTGTQRGSAR